MTIKNDDETAKTDLAIITPTRIEPAHIALFLSILITIAVVALAVYSYFSHLKVVQLEKQIHQEQADTTATSSQAATAIDQINALVKERDSDKQALQAVKSQLATVQARPSPNSSDAILIEVKSLALMANERLNLAHDISSAINALTMAEEQLAKSDDPRFATLKEALAKDIAVLKNLPEINRETLWEQLNTAKDQLDHLHFKQLSENTEVKTVAHPPLNKEMPAWQKALQGTWQEFKSLVRVTKVDENKVVPALAAQDKAQILRTIQGKIEETQWALLHGNHKIYAESLHGLHDDIQTYFAANQEQITLLKQIEEWQQQSIGYPTANIQDTLEALSEMRQHPQKDNL
ncbi:MAG: uroporphyrinogen-III C-methyltransferase [Candidatus Berkiellales bacterium]